MSSTARPHFALQAAERLVNFTCEKLAIQGDEVILVHVVVLSPNSLPFADGRSKAVSRRSFHPLNSNNGALPDSQQRYGCLMQRLGQLAQGQGQHLSRCID